MTDDTISTSLSACFARFEDFLRDVYGPQKLERNAIEAWQDERGRLRVWARDVGASRKGQTSLQFKLRDSSHILENTSKLLETLEQFLLDARMSLFEAENSEEVYADESSEGEDNGLPTEIEELRESVANIIRCLFRMSVLIRDPAPHDFLVGFNGADTSAFAQFDYNYIKDKLPQADEGLASRLAKAITHRRGYFKYRERFAVAHREETEVTPQDQLLQDEVGSLAESVAYTSKDTTTTTESTAWSAMYTDRDIESEMSQTSFTSSALFDSKSSIPSPPKRFYRVKSLDCPYCYCAIAGGSTRLWIAHLFQDLQPYMCLESECVIPDKLYSSKHRWMQHTKLAHPGSPITVTDKDTTIRNGCQLCGQVFRAGTPYSRHMARHLQELALFALPRKQNDEDLSEEAPSESPPSSGSSDLSNLAERRSSVELPIDPEVSAKIDSLDASYQTDLAGKIEDLLASTERRQEQVAEAQELIDHMNVDILGPLAQIDRTSNPGLVAKIDSLESTVRAHLRALGLMYVAPFRNAAE